YHPPVRDKSRPCLVYALTGRPAAHPPRARHNRAANPVKSHGVSRRTRRATVAQSCALAALRKAISIG
ncbi:MAG TPA: hypothetical protein VK601_15635, partial [Kofleriaceae bacterium]|nr:hypothetical protein [Kofleriaceae bacterium]